MTRKYRKRKRAEAEQETRRRIAQALVDLHGSVGPARTTVQAVAERAGVQRATVYRHYPDEPAMFAACSAHWAAENPFPQPKPWTAIRDAGERARTALSELYAFYGRNERMLSNTTRDEALVPALRPSMEAYRACLGAALEAIVCGRSERGARRRLLRAAVSHALSFRTWQSLVREQGLSDEEATALMTRLTDAAGAAPDGTPAPPAAYAGGRGGRP